MEPRGRERHRWANREVEWSFWEKRHRRQSRDGYRRVRWEANEFQMDGQVCMVTDELRGNGRINGGRGSGRHGREWSPLGSCDIDGKAARPIERERKSQARRVSDFTRSRNDSRGPNILTIGKCPATLPRSRLSVNRPSRPKDQQIFRE